MRALQVRTKREEAEREQEKLSHVQTQLEANLARMASESRQFWEDMMQQFQAELDRLRRERA